MISLTPELARIITDKFKVGDDKRPVCKIEVDRMAFIPGYNEEVEFQAVNPFADWENGDCVYTTGFTSFTFPIGSKSLDTNKITSHYGMRTHPVLRTKRMHTGVDITGTTADKVVACWPGKVKEARNFGDYGNCVDIMHPNNIVTRYAHLSKISVTKGQAVQAGTLLGYVGSTGMSTGPHLHFEIIKDGKQIDPEPYIKGSRTQDFTGYAITSDKNALIAGPYALSEDFLNTNWFKNPIYQASVEMLSISVVATSTAMGNTEAHLRSTFTKGETKFNEASFYLKPELVVDGILSVCFSTDFSKEAGDDFYITIDGKKIEIDKFLGSDQEQFISAVKVPGGKPDIRFVLKWAGSADRVFKIHNISIRETIPGTADFLSVDDINNYMSLCAYEKKEIPTGMFIYEETLTLENVISCEVNYNYEQEAAEASITIENYDGFYSPDYNPSNFPELYADSPFSYFIGDMQVSVLSDNTPIRIYMGYGDYYVRVFTGLIDKVDMDGSGQTLSLQCRDMYKRIIEKVITEKLTYGNTSSQIDAVAVNPSSEINLSSPRSMEIVAAAQKYASQFGVDWRFLIAICQHETVMGTAGAGRPQSNSYVLGYGVPDSGKVQTKYAGVETQMYYGAKRIADVFKQGDGSIKPIKDQSDVEYFRTGGSTGLIWATDAVNWTPNVWNNYQQLMNTSGQGLSTSAHYPTGHAWLLSAVIHDLVNHAGLIGWRMNEDDVHYPDTVIEETYYIDVNPITGTAMKADPDVEGKFVPVPLESSPTLYGWMNPYVITNTEFAPFQHLVSDAINELLKDSNLWSHCDRYGTYRLEQIRYDNPVVAEFSNTENLITISKSYDYSRARSHLVVTTGEGGTSHFIDDELLFELKGQLRSAVMDVPWAKSSHQRRQVAERFFFDVKRLSRTVQVVIPGNPALDVLDRVRIVDKNTATSAIYIIKGIRHSFSRESGYIQSIDLMWSGGRETIRDGWFS